MSTHYHPLTQAQRYQIWSLRETGQKLRATGERVGVDFSTVSRELRRNRSTNGYDPQSAHCLGITRKHTAAQSNKLSAKTDDLIEKGLGLSWSPDAISRRMKRENLSKDEPHDYLPSSGQK